MRSLKIVRRHQNHVNQSVSACENVSSQNDKNHGVINKQGVFLNSKIFSFPGTVSVFTILVKSTIYNKSLGLIIFSCIIELHERTQSSFAPSQLTSNTVNSSGNSSFPYKM